MFTTGFITYLNIVKIILYRIFNTAAQRITVSKWNIIKEQIADITKETQANFKKS